MYRLCIYLSILQRLYNLFLFYAISLFRFKMKDRAAGPRSVPSGSVRTSRFLLPTPPFSSHSFPFSASFLPATSDDVRILLPDYVRATNKRLVEVNVKAHKRTGGFLDDVVVARV